MDGVVEVQVKQEKVIASLSEEQVVGVDECEGEGEGDSRDHDEESAESGTEEEQHAFLEQVKNFYAERNVEFRHPRFQGEDMNCLKFWRIVQRLGGYDQVTACKLWREVGKSFNPPKTCTALAWLFRNHYEKSLLDYERYKTYGDRQILASLVQETEKHSISRSEHEEQITSVGSHKRKNPYNVDDSVNTYTVSGGKETQTNASSMTDNGSADDWVKIYVRKSKFASGAQQYVNLGMLEKRLKAQEDALAIANDRLIRLKWAVEATEKEIETLKQGKDDASKAVAEARKNLNQLGFYVVET